jgi:hypothetical protein
MAGLSETVTGAGVVMKLMVSETLVITGRLEGTWVGAKVRF